MRNFHKTAIRNDNVDQEVQVPKRIRKLKAKQRKFQIEDCVPIYLKAGLRDKILYNVSLILTGVGFIMSCGTLAQLVIK